MRNVYLILSFAAAFGGAMYLRSATPEVRSGSWAPSGVMTQARTGAAAVRLADGRVLMTGGTGVDGVLETVELFGPTGSFSRVASMSHGRSQHVAVALDDGRVLVTGGKTQADAVVSSAELYDVNSNTWLDAGMMNSSRIGHSATLLPDGRVLIAGGQAGDVVHTSLELFDPGNNQFEMLGVQMTSPRTRHGAALLPDGRVLLAGGFSGGNTLQTTDIFDPRDGTLSRGPDLLAPREDLTATSLLDGKVLIAGGSLGAAALATAEIFDPVTAKFSLTGAMTTARRGHLAFLLPNNNRVLLVGGDSVGSSAELFTPWRGGFQPTGNLREVHSQAAGAAVGLDGALLLAGGRNRALNLDTSNMYRFATIRTERDQYTADSAVTLSGSGWQPGEAVRLLIQEFPKQHEDHALTATADTSGNVSSQYKLDSRNPDAVYYVTANGSASEAQLRFASAAANLDQCANGILAAPTGCTTSAAWVNGNVNEGKAHYFEGNFLPYRMVMTGLSKGSHQLTIQWDTTKGGKHALDYIGYYNATEKTADPCVGVSGCSYASGDTTNGGIPPDPTLGPPFNGTQIPGAFTIFGGSIPVGGISGYTPTGTFTGDSSNQITITFNAPAGNSTVVLAWGGHIGDHRDWPTGTSASNIGGSPFHTRLVGLDGSGGNQDRSLSSGAVIFPASITVVKHANPSGSTPFSFGITGGLSPASFPLTDNSDTTDPSQAFSGILSFTSSYTVTETVPSGWASPPSISCAVLNPNGGPTPTVSSASVTISPKEGEDWTCTYTNTQLAGITIIKNTEGGDGTFSYTTSSNLLGFDITTVGNTGSNSFTSLATGNYTVTESAPANGSGWQFKSLTCTPTGIGTSAPTSGRTANITLGANGNVTCTYTNTKQGSITVFKTTEGGNGSFDFTTTGSSPVSGFSLNTVGNSATQPFTNVPPGSYSITESAPPPGWQFKSLSCQTNGTGTSATSPAASPQTINITLGAGGSVSCTYTNTAQGSIKIVKNTTGGDGTFGFTSNFGVSSIQTTAGTGSQTIDNLSPNPATPYSISETAQTGWDAGTFTCTNGTASGIIVVSGQTTTCTITNTKQGSIKVVKNTTGGDGTFGFTSNFGVSSITTSGGTNSQTVNNLTPNPATPYSISETAQTGWDAGTFSCTNGTPSAITVVAGQTTTCTITNTKQGSITIVKNTVGGDGTFGFTSNFGVSSITTSGGTNSQTVNNLTPNPASPYSISETAQTGWDAGTFSCTNGTAAGIIVVAGQTTTCTIINTKQTTLTIVKICAPTNDITTQFSVNVSSVASAVTVTCNDIIGQKVTLSPAVTGTTYTLTEPTLAPGFSNTVTPPGLPNGWNAPGTFGGDCGAAGSVTLLPGDNKKCYILNVSNLCTPPLPGPSAQSLARPAVAQPVLQSPRTRGKGVNR